MISEYDEWFQDDQSLIDLEAQAHQPQISYWPKLHKKSYLQQNKQISDCHFCKKKGHQWRRCFLRNKESPDWTFKNALSVHIVQSLVISGESVY